MSGRRAGILGLLAGGGFLLLLTQVRTRRAWIGVLVLAVLAGSVGAALAPKPLKSGRWETVVLAHALYENTFDLLKQNPLIGVGPGQLGALPDLGDAPAARREPPAVPRRGQRACPQRAAARPGRTRPARGPAVPGAAAGGARRLRASPAAGSSTIASDSTVLGLGAALAAVMAAEATSVGMRHPGVAALLWALVGIGYAAGLRSGGFDPIAHCLDARVREASRYATLLWAVWVAAAASLCVLACGAWRAPTT